MCDISYEASVPVNFRRSPFSPLSKEEDARARVGPPPGVYGTYKRQPLWPLPGIGACVNHHRRQCKRPVLSNIDRAAQHAFCECLHQSHDQGWLLLVLNGSCFTKTVCRPWVRNPSVTASSCNRGTHMQRSSVARLHPQRLSRRVGVIPC